MRPLLLISKLNCMTLGQGETAENVALVQGRRIRAKKYDRIWFGRHVFLVIDKYVGAQARNTKAPFCDDAFSTVSPTSTGSLP